MQIDLLGYRLVVAVKRIVDWVGRDEGLPRPGSRAACRLLLRARSKQHRTIRNERRSGAPQ
jgi:hypothetical protein